MFRFYLLLQTAVHTPTPYHSPSERRRRLFCVARSAKKGILHRMVCLSEGVLYVSCSILVLSFVGAFSLRELQEAAWGAL